MRARGLIRHLRRRMRAQGVAGAWASAPLLAVALIATVPSARAALEPLPAVTAAVNETTVSGISSGGYMAVQMQVAYSATVRGAAIVAGGPFGCAGGSAEQALGPCMEGAPDADALAKRLPGLAAAGQIDSPSNLAKHRVWMFSGSNDGVVRRPVMRSLEAFYRHFVPASKMFLQDSYPAGHAFPTREVATPCGETGGAFLVDCGYDAAGELLQHLYGRLSPPEAGQMDGRIVEFDQRPFVDGSVRQSGLADRGFLFLPRSCERGERCRVHVAFHGCRQNASTIGRAFVERTGYNRWAAANRIAVLYPQTATTWGMPFNPKGCWDWWGYTGDTYATRSGKQVAAVRAMLARLTADARLPETVAPASPFRLSVDAADDAAAVRWPAGFTDVAIDWHAAGRPRRSVRPGTDGGLFVLRDLVPGQTYDLEVRARPAGAAPTAPTVMAASRFATRAPTPECETYFSDNVRHVTRGRANAWWARAIAAGTGDDLGWWSVWTESQVTREGRGFRRGTCG